MPTVIFSMLERKWSVVGIPRYYTKWFVILHKLVHAFQIFIYCSTESRTIFLLSRNLRYTAFSFKQCISSGGCSYSKSNGTVLYSILLWDSGTERNSNENVTRSVFPGPAGWEWSGGVSHKFPHAPQRTRLSDNIYNVLYCSKYRAQGLWLLVSQENTISRILNFTC